MFAGAFGYADHIVIVTPSIYCMRQMILMFNPIKSKLLCYNLISDFIPSVKLCGQYIEVVSDVIHLGNHIYNVVYRKICMCLLVIFIDGVIILLAILSCVIVLH